MRISTFFRIKTEKSRLAFRVLGLAVFFLLIGVSVNDLRASSSQQTELTLKLENKTLKEIFSAIEKNSEYVFFYKDDVIDNSKKYSINVTNKPIGLVLDQLFGKTGNTYRISDRQIFVSKAASAPQGNMRQVKGNVTDLHGKPMVGVSVIVKGTQRGTTTNLEGNYTILAHPSAILEFSFLGYKKQEAPANNAVVNVSLAENRIKIEDVVVTGISNIPRQDMVGSYDVLKMEDIMMPAYTSVEDMLQGQVAGLIVTRSTNRAGSSPSMLLRGQSTILGNSNPLWVIDGIEQPDNIRFDALSSMWSSSNSSEDLNQYIGSQISWLNPYDIEAVTVLKDASATSVYGSRASNGVIVITTKKGTKDRLSVNFSTDVTIKERPTYSNYSLMNSQQRVNFSKEAFNGGVYYSQDPIKQDYTYEGLYSKFVSGEISEAEFKRGYNYLETVNTDWLDILTRTAITQKYNLSVSGGAEKVSFSASASYSKDQGTEIGNDNQLMSGRLFVGYTVSDKMKFTVSLTGSNTETEGFTAGVNPLDYAINTSRAIPVRNEDGLVYYKKVGSYYMNGDTKATGLGYNILNERDNSGMTIKAPDYHAAMTFQWKFLPNFTYDFNTSYSSRTRNMESYAGARTHYIAKAYRGYDYDEVDPTSDAYKAAILKHGGELNTTNLNHTSYTLRNQIRYANTFKEHHRIMVSTTWDISSSRSNSKSNTVWGYDKDRGERIAAPTPIDEIIPLNSQGMPAGSTGYGILGDLYRGRWSSDKTKDNKMAVVIEGTYSFKNRYVVNLNGRNDWSNRFGQDARDRFNPAYSAGLGWNAHNEPFLSESKWLNELRINVTYGIQGNVLYSESPELVLSKGSYSSIYGQATSNISKLPNELLDWEKTKSWNWGLNMMMFGGKLGIGVDAYTRRSDASSSSGLTPEYGAANKTLPMNGTIIRNSGIEASINYVPIRSKDWRLAFSFNFSKNWNKITDTRFDNLDKPTTDKYLAGQTSRIYETGRPYGAFWSYAFKGLDPATGYPTFYNMDPSQANTSMAFTDFLVYSGSKIPSINGGFVINVGYKAFTLNTQWALVLGKKDRLPNPYVNFTGGKMPEVIYNMPTELLDRWQKAGDEAHTNVPGLYKGSFMNLSIVDPQGNLKNMYSMWGESDERVVSSSFIRCRTIRLSWRDNSDFWRKIGVRNVSFSIAANNLFLIADKAWKGMDPELGGTQVMPRSYSFSINLGF